MRSGSLQVQESSSVGREAIVPIGLVVVCGLNESRKGACLESQFSSCATLTHPLCMYSVQFVTILQLASWRLL